MSKLNFEPIIGLEIHVELKTRSKMFCPCLADYFGKEPNTHTCPVCLGLPGALPVPNAKAIEWSIKLGQALNCTIPLFSKFDRKNYFYPDLPKGYQISQYDKPFCVNGNIVIASPNLIGTKQSQKMNGIATLPSVARNDKREEKIVRITRVHMEEDTAKLVHQFGNPKSQIPNPKKENFTLIDFNRSGVPLVEIVTEPDIKSSDEAKAFLKELYLIIRYLGISDADMEKGSMRLEPNISVQKGGRFSTPPTLRRDRSNNNYSSSPSTSLRVNGVEKLPAYKVEVKNINSFNFVKRAIDYEIERQIEILERGEIPTQETRGWNEVKGITYSQRTKEEAHDYRYFPEPDIPPFKWEASYINNLKKQLPELPQKRRERLIKEFNLKAEDVDILVEQKEKGDYLEQAVDIVRRLKIEGISPQELTNWIVNKKINIDQTVPAKLIEEITKKRQKSTISPDLLNSVTSEVLKNNKAAVSDYQKGKQSVLMFLVGQVLRATQGKGKPEEIKKLLTEKLT